MSDFYAIADLRIDELNKLTLGRFEAAERQLRRKKDGASYDPLLVSQVLTALYQQLDADFRHELYLLADEQYEEMAGSVGLEELDVGFEDLFLEDILSKPDTITHYAYDAELLRKRDRAIEAVNAVSGVQNKQAELDKAMRFWAQMAGQYADTVAYEAAIKAYKDAGIKYVKWVTQNDEKVCADCESKSGKLYQIGKIPKRPHWRCRCYVIPLNN